MTVSVGTLLILIDANAKAQALSSAMTNLTFALDSITRNIRTGSQYYCTNAENIDATTGDRLLDSFNGTNDCAAGGTAIIFTPGYSSNIRMAYRLNSTDKSIEQWVDRDNVTDSWVAITSTQPPAAVTIDSFRLIAEGTSGASVNEYTQPRVTLFIAGSVQNGLASSTAFEIQSGVTQRVLNY